MSRRSLALHLLLPALLCAAPLDAQVCAGLSPDSHTSAALGFEGTDGLSGHSAAVLLHRGPWGLQVKGERYDDQSPSLPAWYGGELQAVRAIEQGALAGSCVVAAARYQAESPGSARYERLRVPAGLAYGTIAISTQAGLVVTPYVQGLLLLQRERLRPGGDQPAVTRDRVAPAGTAGIGFRFAPVLARVGVHYALLTDYTLRGRANWMELTMQVGMSF